MTRINVIPVEEVMDLHLIAERKEIIRVPSYLRKSIRAGKVSIPPSYTLGTGHVKFFYDKGRWLENRFNEVIMEMVKRKMNPDLSVDYPIEIFKEMGFYNDWVPTEEAMSISRERIQTMINLKPHLYKLTSTEGWMCQLVNRSKYE